MTPLDAVGLPELARTALAAVQTEYPHWLVQEIRADSDLRLPREQNPSFYGSCDWHSAVHNHWLLVRALDRGLPADLAVEVTSLLDEHLTPARLAAEKAFIASPGGQTSERPYGWAWLILLHAECHALAAAAGPGQLNAEQRWADALSPLAAMLSERLLGYFGASLAFPIRAGTHGNTALSLHLVLQAARRRGDQESATAMADAAIRFFGADADLPWAEPPSGDAFLSPPLTEAALMADVLPTAEFAPWLDRVLPDPARAAWAPPVFRPDGADNGTVHLEGLLISRAWCLDSIARALPPGHPVTPHATAAATAHLAEVARLDPADGFNRSHWLPTFLLYLDEQMTG